MMKTAATGGTGASGAGRTGAEVVADAPDPRSVTERDDLSVDMVAPLSDVLLEALKALAAAGEADAACRLAGQSCAVFRDRNFRQWQRYNALLHKLSRRADPFSA